MIILYFGDHGLRNVLPVEEQHRVKNSVPAKMHWNEEYVLVIQDLYKVARVRVAADELVCNARRDNWRGQAVIVTLRDAAPTTGLWGILAEDPFISVIVSYQFKKGHDQSINEFKRLRKINQNPPWQLDAVFDDLNKIHYAKIGFLSAMRHHLSSWIRGLDEENIQQGRDKFERQLMIVNRTLRWSYPHAYRKLSFDKFREEAEEAEHPYELAAKVRSAFLRIEATLELHESENLREKQATSGILYICSRDEDFECLRDLLNAPPLSTDIPLYHAKNLAEARPIIESHEVATTGRIGTILSGYRFYTQGKIATYNGYTILRSLYEDYRTDHIGYITEISEQFVKPPIENNLIAVFNKFKLLDQRDPNEIRRLLEFVKRNKIEEIIATDEWPRLSKRNQSDAVIREIYATHYLPDPTLKNNIYKHWELDAELVKTLLAEDPFDDTLTMAERGSKRARKICNIRTITTKIQDEDDLLDLFDRVIIARRLILALYNYHGLVAGSRLKNFPPNSNYNDHQQKLSIIFSLLELVWEFLASHKSGC